MEEQKIIKREAREWDAQGYDEADLQQNPSFLDFLKQNTTITKNSIILSIGCGPGKLENTLAQKAFHVDGIDASKNMINYAQKKYQRTNLSFEHCFAEDFIPRKAYTLAIAAFSIHWIEDKKETFKRINNSLKMNGEFFALLPTTDNPQPVSLTVAMEMLSILHNSSAHVNKNLTDLTDKTAQNVILGCSYPSCEKLNNILKKTGFEIIKNEEQSFTCTMSEEDIKKTHWATFSSRPFIKQLSADRTQQLFLEFINRYKEKLTKTNDGKFLDKTYTTLIYARKIKNLINI